MQQVAKQKVPMTEEDEQYLWYLQSRHSRLNTDQSYRDLTKYVNELAREGK